MGIFNVIIDTSESMNEFGKIGIINSLISYFENYKKNNETEFIYSLWNSSISPLDIDKYEGIIDFSDNCDFGKLYNDMLLQKKMSNIDYFIIISDANFYSDNLEYFLKTFKDSIIPILIGCDSFPNIMKNFNSSKIEYEPKDIYLLFDKLKCKKIMSKELFKQIEQRELN
ncbi:MAG: hypothetical protein JJE21_09055 [Spirochaetaceae bacterium]|nr:hypothetical protein [Spirochaetaceae bacterium]